MKRVAYLLMAALLAAVPTVASAQTAPGRSGSSTERWLGAEEGWVALSMFGSCYAAREQAKALRFVATQAGSVEEAKTYKALFTNSDELCLGDISEMRFPYKYVRGAIAEGLYVKRVPVPAEFAVQPVPREKVASFMDAAICLASQHRAEAQALIATTPASKKEDAAMATIRPYFLACLPENMPSDMSIDTTLFRFRVAEALWRLGATPQ